MTRVLRAILVTGALLGSLVVASTSTAQAGSPSSFNEIYESIPMSVNGDYTPIVGIGCDGGDGVLFILWYGPGNAADHMWEIESVDPFTFSSEPMSVNGDYEPLVGDFDGDGCDDILWYGPGGAPDHIWWGGAGLSFTSQALTINGTYDPVVGRFGGDDSEDDTDDIFWYAPGPGTEHLWAGREDRSFMGRVGPAVNGTYVVEGFQSTIVFHKPGPGTDYLWFQVDAATGDHGSATVRLNGSYRPEATYQGILLYGAGAAPDHLLYGVEDDGTPKTVPGTINGTFVDDVRSPRAFLAHVWHAPGSARDYLWIPGGLGSGGMADAMAGAETGDLRRSS